MSLPAPATDEVKKRGPGRPPKDPNAPPKPKKTRRRRCAGPVFCYLLKVDRELWDGLVFVAKKHRITTARLVETILRAWYDKWTED